ncbi:MAG: hypothetical protein R6V03_04220 [Kiritimatiellia bacterium]
MRIWPVTEDAVGFSAVVVTGPNISLPEEMTKQLTGNLKAQFGFAETTLEARTGHP